VATRPESMHPEPMRPGPVRAEPVRQDYADRGPRRDPRRRDDDLGPSVQGFGEEVPAFMLVAARPRRAQGHRVEELETEAST